MIERMIKEKLWKSIWKRHKKLTLWKELKPTKAISPKRKLALQQLKKHIEVVGELTFVKEQALPQLYKQADIRFGKDNWYVIHFDPYWDEDEKFYYLSIICHVKPTFNE